MHCAIGKVPNTWGKNVASENEISAYPRVQTKTYAAVVIDDGMRHEDGGHSTFGTIVTANPFPDV